MRIISTEYPYFPARSGIEAAVLAVLVQDSTGKYRAYVGLARHPDDRLTTEQRWADAQWVASFGRKLTYKKAFPEYFIGIEEKDYAA